ncbi:MAG: twin-arginine translocation signal domain-containing protein [Pirellulales bacterium]|nr:twin-arginine translocation signal domain-containing protein [Pirellulales bacterium]
MSPPCSTRRDFLKTLGLSAAAVAATPAVLSAGESEPEDTLAVDPQPRYELSPYLYMQFMEPLGNTDSSVEAAWDFTAERWRDDVVDVTARLGPPLLRWGGLLAAYYRWKEAVGPRDRRRPMLNLCWGGVETNQIGTAEFVEFCRRVGANPLMCVNFESEGRPYFAQTPDGDVRSAGPDEAAEWVAYCNDPDNALRREHGVEKPHPIRLWQIGNETSYDGDGFDCETAARKTAEFAQAMHKADPDIELIGWGDSGWGPRMMEIAGEHLQYLAFHHMFDPGGEGSPLYGTEYRKDPARTWDHLMRAAGVHDRRIRSVRERTDKYPVPLAMTECHFALQGRNRCEVLSSWAAGVAYARMLNVHQRHGDKLKIATAADFCGTRWQVNAVMIPVPGGESFMMPVALVMCLYRHHTGKEAIAVSRAPEGLDVVASRTADRVFLHVVNTNRQRDVRAGLTVAGRAIHAGRVFEISGDPEYEVIDAHPAGIHQTEKPLPADAAWTFPAASVSAVELETTET